MDIHGAWVFSKVFEESRCSLVEDFSLKRLQSQIKENFSDCAEELGLYSTGNRRHGNVQSRRTTVDLHFREIPLAALWNLNLKEGERIVRTLSIAR